MNSSYGGFLYLPVKDITCFRIAGPIFNFLSLNTKLSDWKFKSILKLL